jgi:hypothetical protein
MAISSIVRPNVIFCGRLVHFVVIWYIFPVLVCCTEKNLATLFESREKEESIEEKGGWRKEKKL